MANQQDDSSTTRVRISRELRDKVLANFGHKCAHCGASKQDGPLSIVFVQAVSEGGEATEENLTVLCPTCHLVFDKQPSELEFNSFLAELLKLNPQFKNVQAEAIVDRSMRFRADLLAERIDPKGDERLLIECKRTPVPSSRLHEMVAQLRKHQEAYGNSRLVLAVPATLPTQDLDFLGREQIEVWDLSYIATNFRKQIPDVSPGYYQFLFTQLDQGASDGLALKLIADLKKTQPGKKDWSVYQSLVGDILELLFCPHLLRPISEHADLTQTNRRDFILPNYAESGFWAFMRTKYSADYVVVDAKNYTGKVKKNQVLQLANYLKPHGAGLFGMIICRVGSDTGGSQVTLREQWLVHQKLILILNDHDLEAMLLAKADGRNPEEVIGRKIEDFRLAM